MMLLVVIGAGGENCGGTHAAGGQRGSTGAGDHAESSGAEKKTAALFRGRIETGSKRRKVEAAVEVCASA